MGGACGVYGGNSYRVSVGRPEVKRPLVRPRIRWEGNIKTNLKEIDWKVVDWVYLAQHRDQW